jgi:hypothetical protein
MLRELSASLTGLESVKSIRAKVSKLAENDYSELAAALDRLPGTEHAQMRAIVASVLAHRASTLGPAEGMALLLRIQNHEHDSRSTLTHCIGQWTADSNVDAVLQTLSEIKNQAPVFESEVNALSLYARAAINANPATVFEVIRRVSNLYPEQVGGAYRAAAIKVSSRRIPLVHNELVTLAENGDANVGPALQHAARRLSDEDPDAYATQLESLRGNTFIYDNLAVGFVQSIAKRDTESASAWARTISNLELRGVAERAVAVRNQ